MANEQADFLTTLATRNGLAAGEPPAVRPRLASRFEPLAATSGPPVAGAWPVVTLDEVAAAVDSRRPAPARDGAARDSDGPAAQAAPSRPERSGPPAPAEASGQPALRVIERWMAERETHTIRVIEREAARPAPASALPELPASPAVPRAADRAAASVDGPSREAEPARPSPAPRPPARVRPSPQPVAPRGAAGPARPDVHITIGRIEVRAAPAPAHGRPTAARPPTPSLERYLDSLGGDGGGGER